MTSLVDLRDVPLSLDECVRAVSSPDAGAVVTFVGAVRRENEGREVTRLDYEAYRPMALAELARIVDELSREQPEVRLAVVHRVGELRVGDLAVVCAASAPHRREAFVATRELIDRVKERVPIWKREHGPDGTAWVGWEDARCSREGHHHDLDHAHAQRR